VLLETVCINKYRKCRTLRYFGRGVIKLSLIQLAASCFLLILLTAGSLIDLRSHRLPDWVTLSLIGAGLILSFATSGWADLWIHALAAAAGYFVFWGIGEFYFRSTETDGLGLGDAKLLAAAGAWLGPLLLAPVVFGATSAALVYAVSLMLRGRRISLKSSIPFGPFLSASFAAWWGARLLHWA